jgi:hypothetical protein
MAVYITLLCAAIIPSFFVRINESEKTKRKYLVFIFSLIALVSSLRCISVGTDTRQFCNAYIEIGYLSWDWVFNLRFEPGFITLCKLLNYASDSYQLLLFASSCFVALSFARFIYKNSDNVVTSTVVFYCMFFAQSMNAMRQYMAVAVLLFGIEFLKEKKYAGFLIAALAAMMFHYSAILCVVYIVIYKLVMNKGLFLALSTALAVVLLNFRQILEFISRFELLRQYSGYIGGRHDIVDSTRWIKMAIALLILLFFVINAKKENNEKGIRHNFIVNMLLLWAAVETLATSSNIFTRFAPYVDYISIIAVTRALTSIKENKLKLTFTIIIYVVMIVYFVVSRMVNISEVMPYRFFWEV